MQNPIPPREQLRDTSQKPLEGHQILTLPQMELGAEAHRDVLLARPVREHSSLAIESRDAEIAAGAASSTPGSKGGFIAAIVTFAALSLTVIIVASILLTREAVSTPDMGNLFRLTSPVETGLDGELTNLSSVLSLIPLRLVTLLPSSDTPLQGRQALTAIFSKSVVAVGSDFDSTDAKLLKNPLQLQCNSEVPIPGRYRWATTTILRFDPDIEWPSDLVCTVSVSPIEASDGSTLSADSLVARVYSSPSLFISLSNILSPSANDATAGRWSAFDVTPPEILPDSTFDVIFSSYVVPELVNFYSESVTLLQNGTCGEQQYYNSSNRGTIVLSKCLRFNLLRGPPAGSATSLQLRAEDRVSPFSGKLTSNRQVAFQGLTPFTFNFRSYLDDMVQFRRYRLFLRHGLSSSAEMLADCVSFQPPVKFRLIRIDKAVIRLDADVDPGTRYTLSFSSSDVVVDAFGQQLQASSTSFTTSLGGMPASEIIADVSFATRMGGQSMSTSMLLPEKASANWTLFSRVGDTSIRCASQGGVSAQLMKSNPASLEQFLLGKTPPFRFVSAPTSSSQWPLKTNQFELADLFSAGTILTDLVECGRRTMSTSVSKCSVALTSIVRSSVLIVWATNTESAVPQPNLEIQLWKYHTSRLTAAKIRSSITDTNGFAQFIVSLKDASLSDSFAIVAVISNSVANVVKDLRIVPGPACCSPQWPTTASLTSDRKLYRIGETVYVKGYLRSFDGTNFHFPTSVLDFRLSVSFSPDQQPVVVPLAEYQSVTGSFHANLTVPSWARYQTHSILLQKTPQEGSILHSSLEILVADPRIPTARLEVLPRRGKIFRPSSGFSVNISTQTFTGVPVPQSTVRVEWRNTGSHIGRSNITTDHNGIFVGKVPFPADLPVPTLGETLRVRFFWQGPTREILSKSFSLPVKDSTWRVTLTSRSTSMMPPTSANWEFPQSTTFAVPQTPFTVDVVVQPDDETVLTGRQISLKLYALPQDIKEKFQVRTCSSGQVDEIPPDYLSTSGTHSCTSLRAAVQGDEGVSWKATCSVTLPTMGPYLVFASLTDSEGFSASSGITAGQSAEWWIDNPLLTPPLVEFSTETLDLPLPTSQIKLNASNPTPVDARALILVSDYDDGRTERPPKKMSVLIPPGTSEITLTNSEFPCVDQCDVVVVVVTPALDAPSFPAPVISSGVPISAYADFAAPRSSYHQFTLTRSHKPPETVVTLSTPISVVEPLSTISIEIRAQQNGEAVSGEVTLIVVDEAVLELARPRPLEKFSFVANPPFRSISSSWAYFDQRQLFVNDTVRNMANYRAQELLSAEPWAPLNAVLNLKSPSSGANLDHLRNKSMFYDLTAIPSTPYDAPWVMTSPCARMYLAEMGDAAAGSMPEMAKLSMRGSASNANQDEGVSFRSQFVPTAAFLPRVPLIDGLAKLNVTLAGNIGTWKVTALVSSTNANAALGIATATVIARKPLTLYPSFPRVVRYNDTFFGGVVATVLSEGSITVSLNVKCDAVLLVEPLSQKRVTLLAQNPAEILFEFRAAGISVASECSFEFSAQKEGSPFFDAIKVPLPVETPTPKVVTGTSFHIESGVAMNEALVLPRSIPNTSQIVIVLAVGNRAATEPIVDGIQNNAALNPIDASGPQLLDWVTSFVVMQAYASPNAFSRSLNPSASTLLRRAKDLYILAEEYFPLLTTPKVGLRYSLRYSNQERCDILLNARAIWTLRRVPSSDRLSTSEMISVWQQAIVSEIRASTGWWLQWLESDYFTSRFYCYMGADFTAPTQIPNFQQVLSRMLPPHSTSKPSPDTVIFVLRALVFSSAPTSSKAKVLVQLMADNVRVTGRTAFIGYPSTGRALSMESQAIFLEAVEKYRAFPDADSSIFPLSLSMKIALWIAQGGQASNKGLFFGSRVAGGPTAGHTLFSLLAIDASTDSTDPNFEVAVHSSKADTSSSKHLYSVSFVGQTGRDLMDRRNYSFEDISPSTALTFSGSGNGAATAALTLTFVPELRFPSPPKYFGIYVEKKYVNVFRQNVTDGEGRFSSGDFLDVVISITTPDDVMGLQITDLSCAGLEAINPMLDELETSDIASVFGPMGMYSSSFRQYLYWWQPFPYIAYESDRVLCFSGYLFAGTHECKYRVAVTSSGNFVVPPAEAHIIGQPEVMGLSAPSKITVLNRK